MNYTLTLLRFYFERYPQGGLNTEVGIDGVYKRDLVMFMNKDALGRSLQVWY